MFSIFASVIGLVSLASYGVTRCLDFSADFERAVDSAFRALADEMGE